MCEHLNVRTFAHTYLQGGHDEENFMCFRQRGPFPVYYLLSPVYSHMGGLTQCAIDRFNWVAELDERSNDFGKLRLCGELGFWDEGC